MQYTAFENLDFLKTMFWWDKGSNIFFFWNEGADTILFDILHYLLLY